MNSPAGSLKRQLEQSKFPRKEFKTKYEQIVVSRILKTTQALEDIKDHQWMSNIVQVLSCLIMNILEGSWKIVCDQLIPSPIPISLENIWIIELYRTRNKWQEGEQNIARKRKRCYRVVWTEGHMAATIFGSPSVSNPYIKAIISQEECQRLIWR